jgi:hypothetical protein
MTSRQCEIAAESYTACILAQAGYDVLVQYGANQPHYDLVAEKNGAFLPISVKGSQTGGWMLAAKFKQTARTYHQAIDCWLEVQRPDVIFFLVQYFGVALGEVPRVYAARAADIAVHMKTQCNGRGHGALHENYKGKRPGAKYDHQVPAAWQFSVQRLNVIISNPVLQPTGQVISACSCDLALAPREPAIMRGR